MDSGIHQYYPYPPDPHPALLLLLLLVVLQLQQLYHFSIINHKEHPPCDRVGVLLAIDPPLSRGVKWKHLMTIVGLLCCEQWCWTKENQQMVGLI